MDELLKPNLEDKERDLLRYYFGLDSNPERFIELIKHIDLEDNWNYLLLISQVCYEQDTWDLVDEKHRERIKGVYRYSQLSNVVLLKSLNKIVKTLNKNGIQCLLLKGGAMRLYFDKNVVRLMNDIDLYVSNDNYKKTCKLLMEIGADIKYYDKHSIAFKLDGAEIDLHSYVFKYYEEKDSNILNRLIKEEIYGTPVYVLSDLDMFIHLLVTQTYCFLTKENTNRHIKWLYDSYILWKRLLEKDFKELPARLEELHCSNSFYVSYKLFEECFPEAKDKCLNVKPRSDYDEWINKNNKILNIIDQFNLKRKQYNLNTFSFKSILLHFEYLIDYRRYQFIRLNSDNRFKMSFIKYFVDYFGLNNVSTFNKRVLKRFRFKEINNNAK